MFVPVHRTRTRWRAQRLWLGLAPTAAAIGAAWLVMRPSAAPQTAVPDPPQAATVATPVSAATATAKPLPGPTLPSLPAAPGDEEVSKRSAAAELQAFPRPPDTRSEQTDANHLLALEVAGNTTTVADWYTRRLRADGYDVHPQPVPALVPLGALSFVTPDGHQGALLVQAVQAVQAADQDAPAVSVLVAIQ